MRTAFVIVLAVAAVALSRAEPAQACAITPFGPGLFGCTVEQPLDPPCPSAADGKTTYLFFLEIPTWARDPAFSIFDSGGAIGPSHSPCPDATVSDVTGQDNAPGGSPGPNERTYGVQFSLTPSSTATGGQTPQVGVRVQYHGQPPAPDCPDDPTLKRPCADVYISRFVSKGLTRDGDHDDARVEVDVTNRGPDRSTGVIEVVTKTVDGNAAQPVTVPYDLAPGETITQPAGAHIVNDSPFNVTVRVVPTTPDPDPSNNGPRSALFRPPATSVKSASGWSIRGIARALYELFARPGIVDAPINRVDVAVLRRGGRSGSCRWLRDRRAHFATVPARHGRCAPAAHWLRAHGTTHWALRFRRRLPPGRYVAYSRAREADGLQELQPSRRAFRVRRARH